MQLANSPHLAATPTVGFSDDICGWPARAPTLACMVPAFRMKYAALGSIFASWPRSTMRKMQLRTTGAVSGRPRRLASANQEPPELTEELDEELPDEKPGISFQSCGA